MRPVNSDKAQFSLFSSIFSFMLVILCSAGLSFVSVRTYVLYGNYTGLTDHFNTIGVIFAIFWLVVIGLVLRFIHPILRLSPGNFALIYAGLMVATVLPSMGFGGYFLPLIAGVFYYATPENNWAELLWSHIPEWAAPRDLEGIRQLFEGIAPDQPIPWGIWLEPLVYWGLFMLAFFFVSVSFISLVHHQWSRQERLVYPLAVVPTMLLESLENPAASLLKSKLLWVGFIFASAFPVSAMLDQVFDFQSFNGFSLPNFRMELRALGVSLGANIDLLVVGLSYLVNLNVLLSVWLVYILIALEEGLLNYLGIVAPLPGQPHAPSNVLLAHQQVGSLIFIVLASLWMGRDFLRQQWRAIVGGETGEGESANLISPRWAAGLGFLGLIYMTFFIRATGLPLGWSIVFLGMSLLMFFGIARLLAQTGIGRLRAPVSVPPVLTNIFGTGNFGAQGVTAMGLSMVWTADIQLFLMGTIAHAFKVCEADRLKISGRRLVIFLTGAMVAALVTTMASYLWLGYRHGLIHGYSWYFVASPNYHWNWVANTINNPNPPQFLAAVFAAMGAGLAGLLSIANYRLVNWPLHPVGLAIALTNTVRIDWFGIFLAWLIKAVILRYGGVLLYRKILPLFIGFILGTCMGVGTASLVYAFYYY